MANENTKLEQLEGALLAHRTLLKTLLRCQPDIRAGIADGLKELRVSAPWSTLPDVVRDAAIAECEFMLKP